jgi:hypothetical protein
VLLCDHIINLRCGASFPCKEARAFSSHSSRCTDEPGNAPARREQKRNILLNPARIVSSQDGSPPPLFAPPDFGCCRTSVLLERPSREVKGRKQSKGRLFCQKPPPQPGDGRSRDGTANERDGREGERFVFFGIRVIFH